MRVLVISALAPPINSPESIQAGRYLSRLRDHQVTLVSADVRNTWEPVDTSLESLLHGVSDHHRRKMLPTWFRRIGQKIYPEGFFPDPYASFFWRPSALLEQLEQRPDVILSRSTPFSSHLLAFAAALHFDCPWIMHVSDPLVDNPFLHVSPGRAAKLSTWEARCFHRAQRVTLTSHKAVAHYQTKYPDLAEKFIYLPNVFDETELNETEVSFDGPLKILFTGRLYGSRNAVRWMQALGEAVRKFPELSGQLSMEFAGFLDEASLAQIDESALPQVKYIGSLGWSAAKKAQARATLLLSIDTLEGDVRADMFFPSKLLDYLAAGRKVIALTRTGSTTYEVVQDRFGWCFDNRTLSQLPDLLLDALRAYARKDATFFRPTADPMEFSLSRQAPRLLQLMDAVCR
jgi:glycosyltransferase involved in cell wall biosynthesis